MNGSQCNWHLDSLDVPEASDPMAEIAELKSNAKVIDLSGDRAELTARFNKTMEKEAGYSYYSNLECHLKWTQPGPKYANDRNPCYDCPYYTEDHFNEARALLCALGREQNDLLDAMYALDALAALDAELARVHDAEIGASVELAAALL